VGASTPASIRLVLADVDGTLVTQEKVLTPAAMAAARDLRRAGVTLAITSGRPPRGMKMLVEPLDLETPVAGFNGGVYAEPDMTVIESHTLDASVARAALDLVLAEGLDAWVYTPDDWLIRNPGAPHVEREAWTVKFEAKVVSEFTTDQLAMAVKIVGVSDDLARVAACERTAREKLADGASAARSQPYYLDITHPLANKGQVVAWLAQRLQIPAAQIAVIGDMPNDVLMFAAAGYSIAMGQASDEVKAGATAVTDTNEADGFAKAIAKLLERQNRRQGETRT
jgi:Cof subfamily protein (haloacid dehalogenase superfamily)